MTISADLKALRDKIDAAQAVVLAKRKKGDDAELDKAKAEWKAAVAEYHRVVDAWLEAPMPKRDQ